MWKDHPILGIGFERSNSDFEPYLAAMKRKFPNQPAEAYPSLQNPWGVQNFWVELLADTGRRRLRARRRARSRPASGSRCAGAWQAVVHRPRRRRASSSSPPAAWNAIGIVAGIPLDAVTWLGLGLAGVAAALTRRLRARADGARHRRRRLHRLEPRSRAARARRRGARARQLLDRVAREPRGARRSRSSRASCARYERVHNAVRGVEVVFHLGALGSVPRSVQDPLTSSAVNVEGTLNVLLAARDEGVRRVVYSSSTSVYGSSSDAADARGLAAPTRSRRTASRKLAAERYCIAFSRVYEAFETVVLRYFNVFGPRQSPSSQYAAVVPLFITAIAAGAADHDPRRRRAVARLHLRRQRRRRRRSRPPSAEGASGRIFNVAAGAPASVNRVADTIGEILGRPVEKVFAPPRPGDIRDSWADLDRRARGARLRAGGLARGGPAADGRRHSSGDSMAGASERFASCG